MILRACLAGCQKFIRSFSVGKLQEINTNVAKDVILFKYDNPRFFVIMNACANAQYVFWSYLAYTSYTSMKDTPVDEENLPPDAKWYQRYNLGQPKVRHTIITVSVAVGTACLLGAWAFTTRSVRYLVLHKGGKSVSFVTYTPFGQNRIMKVDLNDVSSVHSRAASKVTLPIKVRKRRLHYLLDMEGEFKNPTLFDHTVGIKRNFK